MKSFYRGRPSRTFWRTGVAESTTAVPPDLYVPKVQISRTTKIATAGSCFAQHVGNALKKRGFSVLDAEPAPPELAPEHAAQFGYGIFSGRYGNIYTVRQFLQLVQEIYGRSQPAMAVWERGGRFFDALRPSVEPDGLASAELVQSHRTYHLSKVKALLEDADVLVFTLGLTEVWEHRETGTVYPTAPGTIAGSHDPSTFAFRNLEFNDVYRDFKKVRTLLKRVNPNLRFIITVSPVPLAATAEDSHVLPATIYSKSVLRAVAGKLFAEFDDIDYFPSYEIITGPQSRGAYFEDDLRSVTPQGVNFVMDCFFRSQMGEETVADVKPRKKSTPKVAKKRREDDEDEVVCEEALLAAFAE